MRNPISLRLTLHKAKTQQNGKHPIWLVATKERVRKFCATGKDAHPDEWDEASQRFRKTADYYKSNNDELDTLITSARSMINTANGANDTLTLDEFMRRFKGKSNKDKPKDTVIQYFDKRIKKIKTLTSIGNASVWQGARNALLKFAGDKFGFDKLTPAYLEEFEVYLRSGKNNLTGKKCNDGGVSNYMRSIGAMCTDAVDDGLLDEVDHPFKNNRKRKGYKVSKLKIRENHVAMDEWEWELFRNFDYSIVQDDKTRERLEYWHRVFIAAYYGFGTRFHDVARLTTDALRQDCYTYVSKKTKKEHVHGLHEKFLEQVVWFKQKFGETHYIFGILNEKVHISEQQKTDRIKKKLRQYNRALDEIGVLLGLKTHVTSKVARHSMATTLMRGGAEFWEIQQTLVHSDPNTTMRYIKSLGFDKVHAAVLKALK